MIPMIAHALQLVHTIRACETTRAGFSSPNTKAGRAATIGGFFTSRAIKPSMGGMVGGGNPCRFLCAGLLTRHCRPPRVAAWRVGLTAHKGGHSMATSICAPAHSFPYTVAEAAHAARLWFVTSRQTMSLAEWRDHFLHRHLNGIRADDWRERLERTAAWNEAFSASVAAHIAEVSHA